VTVLDLSRLISLDTTGLDALASFRAMLESRGGRLILCAPEPQPESLLRRSGFADGLGEGGLQPDLGHLLRDLRHGAHARDQP
jgi:SulP family sulfate permease